MKQVFQESDNPMPRKQKTHTQSTIAGLEDANAVAKDVETEAHIAHERLKRVPTIQSIGYTVLSLSYILKRIGKLLSIIHDLRKSPHNYDRDKPSGKR